MCIFFFKLTEQVVLFPLPNSDLHVDQFIRIRLKIYSYEFNVGTMIHT